MKEQIDYFQAADGAEISYFHWVTKHKKIRAVLIFLHGMTEHAGRYTSVAQRFNTSGIAVLASDHRGHGRSIQKEGLRGYFAKTDGWKTLMDDIGRLHQIAIEKHPNIPVFIMGHSMGSIAARTYAMHNTMRLDGLIICATAYTPEFVLKSGKILSSFLCSIGRSEKPSKLLSILTFAGNNKRIRKPKTKVDWLNRNPKEVNKYIKDPFCGFIPTTAFYRDMYSGLDHAQNIQLIEKSIIKTPVYLFAGQEDPVGLYGKGVLKVYEKYKKAGFNDVSIKTYAKARHEILLEKNREEVLEDLLMWMENRMMQSH